MRTKLLFCLLIVPYLGFSQMNLDQILSLNLGEDYKKHEKYIKQNFTSDYIFMKGSFNNAFQIIYKDVPFDNYGNANYCFSYLKGKLVKVEIEIEFLKDRFNQIIYIEKLFEKDLISKYETYLNYSELNLSEALSLINSCQESGKHDSSEDTTYGFKSWRFDKTATINSKKITIFLYQQSYRVKCRNVLQIELKTKFLDDFYYSEGAGIFYKGATEYSEKEIKMNFVNGVYTVPIKVNDLITLDFVVDLGAADVSISPDLFSILLKSGTIKQSDFLDDQNYIMADGSLIKNKVFILKSIKLGEIEIKNVRATVSNSLNSPLLLGQAALQKIGKYQIDNEKSLLIIK